MPSSQLSPACSRWEGLVEMVVVIPSDLGDAERALYRRLQELASESEQGG